MDVENNALMSIKDCYKFAVGYGLVDTMYITPPTRTTNQLVQGERVIESTSQLTLGNPVQVLTYRYIPTVCVVPMPDGANVDGINKASGHFVLDLKTESEFCQLYDAKGADGNPIMKGDMEQIIIDAKSLNFHTKMMPIEIIHELAGLDLFATNNGQKEMPVIIPILRAYFDNHHVWIANGSDIIYEQKNKYQTLMSDLIKWSAWPDGLRWFPMGITEASKNLSWGINIWYNGLVDLAMYHLNPTRMINSKLVDDPRNIERGPRSDIVVNGNVKDAVGYMDLPQFPQDLFGMGDILRTFHGNTNAQVNSVREGQVGLVRGGSNALETLLASSTGRQAMAATIMKTGALKPLVEKTLIKKQLLIDKNGDKFVEQAFDQSTGDPYFVEKTVTQEDMRQVFRVEIDLPAARLNSSADFAERAGYFDRAKQDPELFDKRALYEELSGDESLVRRTMLPEEIVKVNQTRIAEANLRAREAGGGQAGTETSQGAQALAGAAGGAV